jgi:hypothetical protein
MTQQLVKAKIKILEGSREGTDVMVHFNPTEYAMEYAASFQETVIPGMANPILQFVNGTAETLSMDLLFDTYTDGQGRDVSEDTRNFTRMVAIDKKTHAPPRVEFIWGGPPFRAVVEKVSQRFTMFLGDGTPVRATLSVSFKQYRTVKEQIEDLKLESSDKTKHRVLGKTEGGEVTAATLWMLAAQEYGEVRFWRHIARFNGIEDPRLLRPGDVILVPPLDDFATREAISGRRNP